MSTCTHTVTKTSAHTFEEAGLGWWLNTLLLFTMWFNHDRDAFACLHTALCEKDTVQTHFGIDRYCIRRPLRDSQTVDDIKQTLHVETDTAINFHYLEFSQTLQNER